MKKTKALMIIDAENNLKAWNNLIVDSKIDDAINLCEANIKTYKEIHVNLSYENNELFKTVLVLAIIFKGLQEFSFLLNFINSENWHTNTDKLEYYWCKVFDSKDRLNYTKSYCKSPIIDSVIREIIDIENHFNDIFGKGLYSSPEIVMDKFICNICNIDTRGCLHIEGNIYGSKICRYKAVNPRLRAVALVEKPRDPRCRIWSWNLKEDNTLETAVLVAFTPDDFLHE